MTYREYLNSPEWQKKRDFRILCDGKCAICGSTKNLQVHHMTYETFPNESPSDLITVCRKCHVAIENMKCNPKSISFHYVKYMMIDQFFEEHKAEDWLYGGDKNYCDRKVIEKDLYPYLLKKGFPVNKLEGGTMQVQMRIGNLRRQAILQDMDNGLTLVQIRKKHSKISYHQIKKTWDNPEESRKLVSTDEYLKPKKDYLDWNDPLPKYS